VSPTAKHEWYGELISDLVKLLARELRIDILSLGRTTFRRHDRKRGFEPDACFYVTHILRVCGKERIDLGTDPPPDIVVEVVVTHLSWTSSPPMPPLVSRRSGATTEAVCGCTGLPAPSMPRRL